MGITLSAASVNKLKELFRKGPHELGGSDGRSFSSPFIAFVSAVEFGDTFDDIESPTGQIQVYYGEVETLTPFDWTWEHSNEVYVADVNGLGLTIGQKYLCQMTGDLEDTSVFLCNASFAADVSSGGGSGSLLVRELDGAPSSSPINNIILDQDTGFQLTVGGGGDAVIAMKDASLTETGVVNTAAQNIKGQKTFDDTGIPARPRANPILVKGNAGTGAVLSFPYTSTPDGPIAPVIMASDQTDPTGTPESCGSIGFVLQDSSSTAGAAMLMRHPDLTRTHFVLTGAGVNVAYANGTNLGLWGTDGVGNVFSGGICTTIGSGGGGATSPLTTKGDVWGYSTTDARIPVGSNGQVLTADSAQALGLKWAAPASSGTVTSVGLSMPTAEFNVANSPVTGADTLTVTWDDQSVARVFAGPPSGADATPTFRRLVPADVAGVASRSYDYYKFSGTSPSRYYIAGHNDSAVSTGSHAFFPTTNDLFAMPFVSPRGGTLDQIGLGVKIVGMATDKIRVGIYDNVADNTPYPNALLVDAGEFTMNAATGLRMFTISQALVPGALVWCVLWYNSGGTASLNGMPIASFHSICGQLGTTNADTVQSAVGWKSTSTYGANLPATFPSTPSAATPITSSVTSIPPCIYVRFSA